MTKKEKDQSENNTVKQTKLAVKCFEDWCQDKGVVMDFQTASKQQFSVILRDFYATVRNGKGELYGLSSYISLWGERHRHINIPPLSLSWCLPKDTEFTTSNNVFTSVVKMLRKKGLDTTVHHSFITGADFKAIKRVLNPNTAGTRKQSVVWRSAALCAQGKRGKSAAQTLIIHHQNRQKPVEVCNADVHWAHQKP